MTATSPYDELTPESIKASMLSDLTAKGVDVSIREGSYANTLVSVAAYQLFKMYQQFPSLLHMAFPDETSGEYIDKNAAQIGMVRAAGKKATVEIAFTGTEGTYIAAGTRSIRSTLIRSRRCSPPTSPPAKFPSGWVLHGWTPNMFADLFLKRWGHPAARNGA